MSEKTFSNRHECETDEQCKAKLDECLAGMREASNQFYRAAVHLNNHTFIEFTGLINEYITVCQEHAANGIDFTQLSAHGDRTLELKEHQIHYLQEKLTCIYGPLWKMNPAEIHLRAHRQKRQ